MSLGIVVIGTVFVDIKGYPLMQYIPNGRNAGRVIQTHGGVSRNVVEDIANVELRPTFISAVDESGTAADVLERLRRHKVNVDYVAQVPDGMGTWLAVFDNSGDVVASISKRPDLSVIGEILAAHGDEIFSQADSVVVEIDMESSLLKPIFALAERWGKEVYAVVSNMSIAMERRDLLMKTGCVVCNVQEAGLLFSEDYEGLAPQQLTGIIAERAERAGIPRMVVTMGPQGAVWAERGQHGRVPPQRVDVVDTTGAGDSFFAGVAIGLTYGKSLPEACAIGTRLAASVIATRDNVCPRFQPGEFQLEVPGGSAS